MGIKKKQERIRKLQETMGKIRATTEEEASDAVTNAVDAVLRDHGKLIAASCAEMKKAYEESYLRKVGVMTKVSQCEGSSLSMPSRQTPPSAAATGMEKAAEAARRAMGGGAGGGMMGQ